MPTAALTRPSTPFEQFATFARHWSARMTDEELEPTRRLRVAHIHKGEYLVRLGETVTSANFVLSGLVRQVFVGPDGRERVAAFGTAGSMVCTYRALLTAQISDLAIQALEPTWSLVFPPGTIPDLIERFPGWREMTARLTEHKFIVAEVRNRTLLLDDATERYRSFLTEYAELAPRIPLAQAASYISVTPEALSRIRRKMSVQA